MIKQGIRFLRGKRILLLQGPIGPFFCRLAEDLRQAGAEVFKINFNGGDWLFYPQRATPFRGTPEEWPEFFKNFLIEHEIEIVVLFGDCRPIHLVAHAICRERKIEVGVFEEGYVRPNYVSLERFGVNGHSRLPRNPKFYRRMGMLGIERPLRVGNVFWYATVWAMLYNTASRLLCPYFPHYRHHRSLTVLEGLSWLRSFWRKYYYRMKEKDLQEEFTTRLAHRYFLVPLQVHNDAQIREHSDFDGVDDFIVQVLRSFAAHAPPDVRLVIKHHPLDRGCADYTKLVGKTALDLGITERVHYVHDLHLPTLLRYALGVVLINSTVGLSALHHGIPVKNCGNAIYDIEGLVYPKALDEFWKNPEPGDRRLFQLFNSFMIRHTQFNGSFYRRLPVPGLRSGILWNGRKD